MSVIHVNLVLTDTDGNSIPSGMRCVVRDQSSNSPVRLYTPEGVLLNPIGATSTLSDGSVDFYVADNGRPITITAYNSGGAVLTYYSNVSPTDQSFVNEQIQSAQQALLVPGVSTLDSTKTHVYTIQSSDQNRTISNVSALPLWIFIPPGLASSMNFTIAQRGRGRIYLCPGAGVELNGVTGVGRYSTCRKGQTVSVKAFGTDAYAANFSRKETIITGHSDYFTLDVTGGTYTVTGNLVTVTLASHNIPKYLNGRAVYMMVATGPLYSFVYDNFQYVDADTFTVIAPASLPSSAGTLSGTLRTYDGSGHVTNLVNSPNTILFGGSGATYSVIGNRITVTMTAHGLTNVYNGANLHMTLTAQSLPTGVYRNFLYIDANTFELQSHIYFPTVSTGSLTANTSETCLAHYVIPGDSVGDGGHLRILTQYAHLANANNKSWRILMGRAGSLNGTAVRKGISSSTTTRTTSETYLFRNGPEQTVAYGGTGTETSLDVNTVGAQKIAFDMTADQTIKFTAQVSVGTDWMILQTVMVEAERGRNNLQTGPGGFIGLNLGAMGSGQIPGTPYVDYTGTSLSQYQRWASKGIKNFRLGFLWERVQQSLSGPLDGPATAIITEQLDFAASVGGKILLDVHNYMKYNGVLIGSGPTQADLVDLWTKLATLWKDHPGVGGWGIMNEPNSGIPIATLNVILQAVVDAIRTVDTSIPIMVSGMSGSMVYSLSASENLRVYDPAGLLRFEAHCYPDAGYGGTVTNYASDMAVYNSSVVTQPQGVMGYTQVIPYAAAAFEQYLRNNNAVGIVGECGAPGGDDVRWMSDNWSFGLASFLSRGWPVYVWSAGGGSTGSQTYQYSVEPLLATPTVDRPQWAYMEPLVRAFPS